MSRLDELIAEYCPDGVLVATLGTVARTVSGLNGKTKSDFSDGNARFVSYRNAFANLAVDQFADDYVKVAFNEKQNALQLGDIVITGSSENVAEVGMSSVVTETPAEAIYLNSFCFILRLSDSSLLLPHFSKHLFRSEGVRSQIRQTASGVTRINVSKARLLKIRIPIPPVEVQAEIARILDQFLELIHALEFEIDERRKQRAALAVNFAVRSRDAKGGQDAITSVRLGSLAREVVSPVRVQPQASYVNLGVKWNGEGVLRREPRSGAEIKATTLYDVRPGQLVYNRMFVVEGSFALVPPECDGTVVSNEFPVFDIDRSVVEPEWLLHYLCDPYTLARIEAEVTGTERGTMKSRRRWKQDQFARFVVELPAIDLQRETLRVLRACDDLIDSLGEELAARRKQYHYYRDKLLTFEEASA